MNGNDNDNDDPLPPRDGDETSRRRRRRRNDQQEQMLGDDDDDDDRNDRNDPPAQRHHRQHQQEQQHHHHHHSTRNPLELFVDWCKALLPHPHPHDYDSACVSPPLRSVATVTLHYDAAASCCVAVLSRPATDVLAVYLGRRLAAGTARRRSALYVELDGHVRPQFHQLVRAVRPHRVHAAVGALAASDAAQRRQCQEGRLAARQRRHGGASTAATTTDPSWLLRQVLDVGIRHRLAQDLNAVDVYHLARTGHGALQAAAGQIVRRQRRHQWKFTARPHVDGAAALGSSRLTRTTERPAVTHVEGGRPVTYRACPAVALVRAEAGTNEEEEEENKTPGGTYVPSSTATWPTPPTTALASPLAPASFAWECEEIALNNLHHWWGDFPFDYVGQKIVIEWHQQQQHLQPTNPQGSGNDSAKPAASSSCSSSVVVLDTIRLDANPPLGRRTWTTRKGTAVQLQVLHAETRAVDAVTFRYRGVAAIVAVRIPFLTLVRHEAKLELAKLHKEYGRIQTERPLLPHEVAYAESVHALVHGGPTKKASY